MMFKALLLQSWYRLSDPGLEKQLARDLLFRRLIDRDLSESVAAQSTTIYSVARPILNTGF